MPVVLRFYEEKKKEIDRSNKQRGKFSIGNHGEARRKVDTAEQGRISVEEALGHRMNVVNAPIMAEDVMDITHKKGATSEEAESIQLGKVAGFQGDLFNEKLREIDLELNKFDLEKDSTTGSVLIEETDSAINGKSNYCGIVTGEAYQELAACENMYKKY